MPIQKKPGKFYVNLAIPAVTAEMTVGAGGVPDATQNPNALYLGETDGGFQWNIEKEVSEEFVDEQSAPVESIVSQVSLKISGDLVYKTLDHDVLAVVSSGLGTVEVAGQKITYGATDVDYTCGALIFELADAPGEYGYVMGYRMFNTAPINRAVSRQNRMVLPVEFSGLAIPGRIATDSIGHEWKPA